MSPQPAPKTRLQLVREQAARGELRADAIQRTRLVVSIDKLAEDPNNERKTLRNMEEMVASVKAHGIIEPITVMARNDGRYQIVTGHRRYRAAKLAGLAQINPALGQDFTPSPTTRCAHARSDVRDRSARRGARVDTSRPCVA